MKYLNPQIQARINNKLKELNSLRPLPKSVIAKLHHQFQIEMTYNSNAIEGSSLTLKETFWVINEGITVKGKPLKDHLEAKDHHEALDYIYKLVKPAKKVIISELLIRSLHQLIVKKTDEEWAGKYRNINVIIAGSDHKPFNAGIVPLEMSKLTNWFSQNEKKLHHIELAALLHHKLVYIHPFLDGNGRTARLLMNIVLIKKGYPLTIILKNDRKKYYRVLGQADKNDFKPLVLFIAQNIERSLDIYLKILKPKPKKGENFLPLTKIAKTTPYSAKYLNLLIRQGKLEAYKEKRDWLTSSKAVKRYIENRKRQRKLSKKLVS